VKQYFHIFIPYFDIFRCWLNQLVWQWSQINNIIEYSNDGAMDIQIVLLNCFPHSWLNTGALTRVTWRVPHVEKELLSLPKHMKKRVFCGVHDARSFVFREVFSYWTFYCLSFDLRLWFSRLISFGKSVLSGLSR
jgi:hypothetical protein